MSFARNRQRVTSRVQGDGGFSLETHVSSADDSNAPLVVILGFQGCTARVARAIGRSFEKYLDYDWSWTVPPGSVTFAGPSLAPKRLFARELARALARPGLVSGGLVLVSFSLAGAFVVRYLHEALTDLNADASFKNVLHSVVGVVFDSGPCAFRSPLPGARALTAGKQSAWSVVSWMRFIYALGVSARFCVSNLVRTGDMSGELHE